MEVYRIHHHRFHALSGREAALRGGRWNPPGVEVVYTSRAYESSVLETLARAEMVGVPVGHVASRIVLPADGQVEVFDETQHPGWRGRVRSHEIGRAWIDSARALALQVPSFVARPWGRNVVLNPLHPDFGRVQVAEVVEARWDPRLF